jgi:hypothetical protein
MTHSSEGTKRVKSACPTRDDFGPFTRSVIIANADLGAFTEFSKNETTGLMRPGRTPVMRIAQRIRPASLHAFWALLRVVVFGPV